MVIHFASGLDYDIGRRSFVRHGEPVQSDEWRLEVHQIYDAEVMAFKYDSIQKAVATRAARRKARGSSYRTPSEQDGDTQQEGSPMAVLDKLVEVEKSLLGVASDVAEGATEVVADVVKTAAELVHNVIETLGGAVKDK